MSAATPFLLRASAAAMWVRCTSWAQMTKAQPDFSDPTVRDEGTCAHWAALMIWLGHRVNVGQRVQIDGMSTVVEVDDDMIDAIDEYLDEIRTWGGKPMLEYRVAAPRIHASCGGTCDAWSYDPQKQTLYVGDMKYGYRFVDVFGNWQLIVYVCGLLDHIGVIDDTKITVKMAIFQPRAYRSGGPWFYWTINAGLLRTYFNILRNAAEQVMSPNAKCSTGTWCSNCDARLSCDAFDAAVENALDVTREPINNDITAGRTDSELLRVSRAFEILEARKSALEARAEMFIRQGTQLSHYEMRPGRSRLRWKPEITPETLNAIGTMQQVELFKRSPITPTQAKKLLNPVMIDGLADRPPAGLKLVRVDDEHAARIFGQTED